MSKVINYFFQSLLIYLFFIVGKIFGLNLSRKIFSNLFSFLGPLFKSKKITENNLSKKSFMQSFLGSIKTKMYSNRK